MDKQRISSEGSGLSRKVPPNGRASRRFISGTSLLPLTLGQPTKQGIATKLETTPRIPTEPKEGQVAVRTRKLTKDEAQFQDEISTKLSPGQLAITVDQRIEDAQHDLTGRPQDPPHRQTAPMQKRLRLEIEKHVIEAYLSDVYGDFLSGHRTRLYEPSWPPSRPGLRLSSPPHRPKSRKEADAILQKIIEPLLECYSCADSQADEEEASQRQGKIAKAIDKYKREREAKDCQEKFQGSGSATLYRNVPDACLEVNILMLISRADLAVQRGNLEHAERLVDNALGMVDKLDYRPLNAKCWYWKGLVADKRGNVPQAAEAFFNALECVGKYVEGDYLPKYIQVYEQDILNMLHIDDKARRVDMARKLEKAAKGVEPFHLPSPKPAQYEETRSDHTPPRTPSPPAVETSGVSQRLLAEGLKVSPSLDEAGRSELRGLNINIPLPSLFDVPQVRRRSASSTPISSNPSSPLKPLPAPRSSLPQEPSSPTKSSEMPHTLRRTFFHSSPTPSRPSSPYASPKLQLTRQNSVLGVVGDIEWQEMVQKQVIERDSKIYRKKEQFPGWAMRTIRSCVQSDELCALRKRFGDDIPNPHADYWESAISKTPKPEETQYNAMREQSDQRRVRTYDHRDLAFDNELAYIKRMEGKGRQTRRSVPWNLDIVPSRADESLSRQIWFDKPASRSKGGDGETRRDELSTKGGVPPKDFLEALRHIHTPGEAAKAEKRQTLFLPLTESQAALRQQPILTQGRSPSQLLQKLSLETTMPTRNRSGSVDIRRSEPPSPSPSPLRRSLVPEGDEGDVESDEI